MKFKSFIIICLLGCLAISCQQKKADVLKKTLSSPDKKRTHRLNKPIGVLDISRDTFVVICYEGLFLTTNAGKTFRDISQNHFSYDLTIDDQNNLWINRSSGGNDMIRHAIYFRSSDWGKHWEVIWWDQTKFLPLHIISQPRQQLRVRTVDDKIYLLTGNNPKTDWKYIDSVNDDRFSDRYLPPYGIDDYSGTKLYKTINHKTDTIAYFKKLSTSTLLKVEDTIYIAGSESNEGSTSDAYFAQIVKEKKIKQIDVPGYYCSAVKGYKGRIWILNGDNLFLKGKDKVIKIY